MPTRYGDEHYAKIWPYPTDLEEFLRRVCYKRDDPHEVEMSVSIFMATPVARLMPAELRNALTEAGLLDPNQSRRRVLDLGHRTHEER